MLLLNYSHPLSDEQLAAIAALLGATPDLRTLSVQIDHSQPIGPQVAALVDASGLSAEDWQRTQLLVNLPGLASAAACLLAELHGRIGYFPAIVRLRPVSGSIATQYEVAELLNLQAQRDTARTRRYANDQAN